MKKVAIGCDPNAAGLKQTVKEHLQELGYEIIELDADGNEVG